MSPLSLTKKEANMTEERKKLENVNQIKKTAFIFHLSDKIYAAALLPVDLDLKAKSRPS